MDKLHAPKLPISAKINLGKPWDENSFGVLAEKVLCDGCGEEIDPRSSEDLCESCRAELPECEKTSLQKKLLISTLE